LTDNAELPDVRERKPVYLEVDGKKFSPTKAGYERASVHGRVMKVTRLANTYRVKVSDITE
jgi:hypothetical protein